MQFSNKAKKLHRMLVSAVAAITFVGGLTALAIDRTQDGSLAANLSYETTVTETETISREIIRRANPEMPKGETVTVQEGFDGAMEVKYHIIYDGGIEVDRIVLSSEVIYEPQDKIVEYGTAENIAVDNNNQKFEYKYVIECLATAYDPSPEENGGYGGQSATGVPLQKGVIAVDPKVIPLGSRVYIEALDGSWSYGYAVAADTGGAIKGNRVDLLFMTKGECYEFGRRQCRVYIL